MLGGWSGSWIHISNNFQVLLMLLVPGALLWKPNWLKPDNKCFGALAMDHIILYGHISIHFFLPLIWEDSLQSFSVPSFQPTCKASIGSNHALKILLPLYSLVSRWLSNHNGQVWFISESSGQYSGQPSMCSVTGFEPKRTPTSLRGDIWWKLLGGSGSVFLVRRTHEIGECQQIHGLTWTWLKPPRNEESP